ncbi:TetR/AcrR family transcriptional regulator [Schaalia sp. Marseille-Q2122]|uniref:TetR/AcrR family transcriptional regulator n=1 Tax=Schaalia sp. Marseille-Q2122 TaxID=2736604 RepID=UPI00158BB5B3|nr:TetR/AcrR family transcriptional regulator [Schaalia sp. Marseille-Q2122]
MPEGRRLKGSYSVGLATREAILKSATELIAEVGYHGISLRDLARHVGISHPAVVYHFPNKESLIRAVVVRWEEAYGAIDVAIDPQTDELVIHGLKIESYSELAMCLMRLTKREDADIMLALSAVVACEATAQDHPARDYIIARREIILDFLTAQAEKAREEGSLGFVIPADRLADMILTYWQGTGLQSRYMVNGESALDTIAKFLATCIVQMKVTPDTLVELSGHVSEEIADVYVRVMYFVRHIIE